MKGGTWGVGNSPGCMYRVFSIIIIISYNGVFHMLFFIFAEEK